MGHAACLLVIAVFFHGAHCQDRNEKIETVTYTGTTTTVTCPGQIIFTLPEWKGPPVISQGVYTRITQDGLYAINPAKPRVSYAADNRSLLVRDTELNDTGIYRCSKQIPAFNGENEVNVRILSGEPAITTSETADDNGVRATEGHSLTVTCTSRGGYPAPTVVWYGGSITGQELVRTSTGTKVGDTYIVTLPYTFTPSRQDDRENLVCRSYYPTPADSQGSQQTAVSLYLYLKPLQPTVFQQSVSVAGQDVSVECRAARSRPAANIFWTYMGQMYSPASTVSEDPSTQTFTAVSVLHRRVTAADNGQTAQCAVTHRALATSLTALTTLTVQYPPKVTVYVTNATVENISTTITCSPSGNPDMYNYSEWIHTWEGHVVTRYPNTPVLTLTRLSYEHSGVYICHATNGIGGYQQGIGMLLVESFPIVIHPNQDFNVVTVIGENVHINVTFYSNSGPTSVKCFRKLNTTDQEVGSAKLTATEVNLPIFNYTVRTMGTAVDIALTVTTNDDMGEYFIRILNTLGSNEIYFNVTEGEPPGTPQMLNTTVLTSKSVNVSWSAGYHGGLDQTFVIQISTDQQSWGNTFLPGRQGASGSRKYHVLDRLSPGTLYYIRMYAQNKKGRSSYTKTTNITTNIKDASECKYADAQTSPATIIGCTVGGIVCGVVLTVVLQCTFIRLSGRRIMKYKETGKPTEEAKEDRHIELKVQSSDSNIDGPAMSYETLGIDQPARPYADLTPTPEGSINTYEVLGCAGQSTHLYSDLKSKQEESAAGPSDGKMYMNLSLK